MSAPLATRDAGTDCRVFAVLYGTDGDSGEVALENHPDNFVRGALDTFVIWVPKVRNRRVSHMREHQQGNVGWLHWHCSVDVRMACRGSRGRVKADSALPPLIPRTSGLCSSSGSATTAVAPGRAGTLPWLRLCDGVQATRPPSSHAVRTWMLGL